MDARPHVHLYIQGFSVQISNSAKCENVLIKQNLLEQSLRRETVSSSDKSRVLGCWSLSIVHPTKPGSNTKSRMSNQSSGAVWKSRWPSWAPVPNKPKVSVDVTQNTSANNMSKSLQRTCQQKVISLRLLVNCILFWRLQHQCTHLQFDCSCNRIHFTNRRILIVIFNFSLLSFLLFLPLFFFFFFCKRKYSRNRIEPTSSAYRPYRWAKPALRVWPTHGTGGVQWDTVCVSEEVELHILGCHLTY